MNNLTVYLYKNKNMAYKHKEHNAVKNIFINT